MVKRILNAGSLRHRLVIASAAWICFGFVSAYFLLSAIFFKETLVQFYDELEVHVQELERLIAEDADGGVHLVSRFSDPRYDDFKSGFYWAVSTNGEIDLASGSLQDLSLKLQPDPDRPDTLIVRHKIEGPTGPLLLTEISRATKFPQDSIRQFIVGTDERHLDAMMTGFNKRLALDLSVLALLMVASAALLLWTAMAPFHRLESGMRAVRSGKARHLDGSYPREVQPLVTEFNTLLIAVSDMLQRARASAGNLAHGLKAPLTIITSEADDMHARGETDSATTIQQQSTLMQRHIDHHLARTRASIIARMPGMRTSLEKELSELISAMQALHKEKQPAIDVQLEPDLFLTTDAHDLYEILGNLLDNAFKFAKTEITISAERSANDMIAIMIDDDGPGLPQGAKASVFDIGRRWDEQHPGNGLGLAIVKELVDLYGGDVQLIDALTGGLRVIVLLPASN